ncbi:MAG: RNA-binding S4 domain-containing protein [Pseudomonadota bacterium]
MTVLRLDKWLWAARFFKTRTLARAAVEGGKVHLNDARVKPARQVRVGDLLSITRGRVHFEVEVVALSDRRGPAPEAQALYAETRASVERREREAEERRQRREALANRDGGRPSKKDRRDLDRLRGRGELDG